MKINSISQGYTKKMPSFGISVSDEVAQNIAKHTVCGDWLEYTPNPVITLRETGSPKIKLDYFGKRNPLVRSFSIYEGKMKMSYEIDKEKIKNTEYFPIYKGYNHDMMDICQSCIDVGEDHIIDTAMSELAKKGRLKINLKTLLEDFKEKEERIKDKYEQLSFLNDLVAVRNSVSKK